MKFIKNFKIFESIELDEIISNINDILLELSDNDIKVNINTGSEWVVASNQKYIQIDIKTNDYFTWFKLEDFKNEFDMLFEYLEQCEFNLSFINAQFRHEHFSLNTSDRNSEEIKSMIDHTDHSINHLNLKFNSRTFSLKNR